MKKNNIVKKAVQCDLCKICDVPNRDVFNNYCPKVVVCDVRVV